MQCGHCDVETWQRAKKGLNAEERKSCPPRDLVGELYLMNLGGDCSQCCCVPAKAQELSPSGASSLGNPDQTCRQEGLEQSRAAGALPSKTCDSNCRDIVAQLQVPFLSWQSLLKTPSKCFFNASKRLSFSRLLISAL